MCDIVIKRSSFISVMYYFQVAFYTIEDSVMLYVCFFFVLFFWLNIVIKQLNITLVLRCSVVINTVSFIARYLW